MLRRVIPLLMALLVGWTAFANRSELALRAQRIYWGWRCTRHVIPAGTVLIESDPQKAGDLLKHNPDYVQNGMQWSGMYLGMVNKFSISPAIQAAYWPEDFRRYFVLTDRGPGGHGLMGAVAFMGERRSADGHRRLVAIPFGSVNALGPERELRASLVLPLPGWFGGFEPLRSPYRLLQMTGRYEPMRLFPGVADPADASHITLKFEAGAKGEERGGYIDVYLLDDDTLSVKLRDPQVTSGM